MKHLFSFLFISFFFLAANGQNLVPNPSFEDYSDCPTGQDQIELAEGWSKYNRPSSTPDYYNSCSPVSGFGVPQSLLLYQEESRACGAYAGLVTWDSNGDREHIGAQLAEQLIIGQKYFISFKTVMGGSIVGGNYFESPSNNIGLKFSTIPFTESNPTPINNYTHLHSTNVISDTAEWVTISGSIVADSAYNYLVLGNFYDNSNTDTVRSNCNNCLNQYSYYLVDDICVSTDSTLCNGGIDLLSCNVSVEENVFDSQIRIYPNPAQSWVNIKSEGEMQDLSISIYDTMGRHLCNENMSFHNQRIDISEYSNGLLFINIKSGNNSSIHKLLKQ